MSVFHVVGIVRQKCNIWLLLFCVLTLVAWGASTRVFVRSCVGSCGQVRYSGGCVELIWDEALAKVPASIRGTYVDSVAEEHGGSTRGFVWPAIQSRQNVFSGRIEKGVSFLVPFWCILLPGLLALAYSVWRRRPQEGCCRTCGYDLRGSTSGRCPECGTPSHADNDENQIAGVKE